ncbi:MAG: hypothetical protein KC441_09375, partial [Anaerolineales bacterium]|nr:hypothetical protein [Anaerolineales bacterium]
MNELGFESGPEQNGSEASAAVPLPEEAAIPIVDEGADDGIVVGEPEVVMRSGREETAVPPEPAPAPTDSAPPFDALHSLTRLLVGGALEGSAELTQRLEMWETFLREEMDETQPTLEGQNDLLRYALVGLVFEGEDKVRGAMSKLWRVQKRLAQTAVHTTRPVTQSRLLHPLQRRLDQAAERGQAEIVRWIQRGQMEEPISRELARLAFGETVDEFIEHLAENNEVQELVQQQSMGLASEVVDQVRQRTFTADT